MGISDLLIEFPPLTLSTTNPSTYPPPPSPPPAIPYIPRPHNSRRFSLPPYPSCYLPPYPPPYIFPPHALPSFYDTPHPCPPLHEIPYKSTSFDSRNTHPTYHSRILPSALHAYRPSPSLRNTHLHSTRPPTTTTTLYSTLAYHSMIIPTRLTSSPPTSRHSPRDARLHTPLRDTPSHNIPCQSTPYPYSLTDTHAVARNLHFHIPIYSYDI